MSKIGGVVGKKKYQKLKRRRYIGERHTAEDMPTLPKANSPDPYPGFRSNHNRKRLLPTMQEKRVDGKPVSTPIQDYSHTHHFAGHPKDKARCRKCGKTRNEAK